LAPWSFLARTSGADARSGGEQLLELASKAVQSRCPHGFWFGLIERARAAGLLPDDLGRFSNITANLPRNLLI
jgi:hypothetical protein